MENYNLVPKHPDRYFDTSHRRGNLNAADGRADSLDRLSGDLDSDLPLCFYPVAGGGLHTRQNGVGYMDPRNLVAHEDRVLVTGERPDPGDDRDRQFAALIEEAQERLGIKDRLRDEEKRAGIDFLAGLFLLFESDQTES